MDQQRAQIAITAFADPADVFLVYRLQLLRHQGESYAAIATG